MFSCFVIPPPPFFFVCTQLTTGIVEFTEADSSEDKCYKRAKLEPPADELPADEPPAAEPSAGSQAELEAQVVSGLQTQMQAQFQARIEAEITASLMEDLDPPPEHYEQATASFAMFDQSASSFSATYEQPSLPSPYAQFGPPTSVYGRYAPPAYNTYENDLYPYDQYVQSPYRRYVNPRSSYAALYGQPTSTVTSSTYAQFEQPSSSYAPYEVAAEAAAEVVVEEVLLRTPPPPVQIRRDKPQR